MSSGVPYDSMLVIPITNFIHFFINDLSRVIKYSYCLLLADNNKL